MSIKIVTSVSTLMRLAAAVGRAKRAGDPEAVAAAEAELKAYEQMVLASGEVML